eukprot:CAMPEP_0170140218 /NCGR_PEP_ID=MMETSP0033_2-20121228/6215_1 /TAXON_ID=195969 /ORGANISM="Dolichomastix tenuilepis, Strain CCMP3274" /LENGTH=183 /DNA_ID=CAMNT_0010376419 /DNA_START=33 /DNA_END=584 /DNA_ORIENTATION=+
MAKPQAFCPPPDHLMNDRDKYCDRSAFNDQERSPFHRYRIVKTDGINHQRLNDHELADFERGYPALAEWSRPVKGGDHKWKKLCLDILNKLMKHKDSASFNAPVNPIAHGLWDYDQVVQHPMDLGTVKQKLEEGEIRHPDQFIWHVRTVFRNCFIYNPAGHYVVQQAERLSSIFEDKIQWHKM